MKKAISIYGEPPASDDGSSDITARAPIATWRKVVAGILDFLTIYWSGGFGISLLAGRPLVEPAPHSNGTIHLTGNLGSASFVLDGWLAVLLIVLMFAYFFVGRRYLGGTVWQRILAM
jgi:hypothetical protein